MKIKIGYYLVMGLLGAGLWAQPSPEEAISAEGKANLGKPRPPRIPDGSYVPKKGMINREKDEFWAGPGEEATLGSLALSKSVLSVGPGAVVSSDGLASTSSWSVGTRV